MAHSDVALLLALTLTVALAYPVKDDEAYYNRLHDLQDSYGKDVRNLDGIDARSEASEARPLFSFLSKADEDKESEKGSNMKFDLSSSSHLDGIGGGHLVRDLELEQGLAPSILDVLLPDHAFVGKPPTFGVVRKYPLTSRSENLRAKEASVKKLLSDPESAESVLSCFTNKRCSSNHLMKFFPENGLPDFSRVIVQSPDLPRHMDPLHLLNTKKSLDSIGGGHLLYSKRGEDSSGEDYLFISKKDLDSLGGGHLLKYKKDLDSIGGGHLLNLKKDLDSIGGGHLLNYKKDLDSIGGGHLLNYKKDLDSIGGGHLLNLKKDLDSIGGGHLLNNKKDLEPIEQGDFYNFKRDVDSIGGGNSFTYRNNLDSIDGILFVKRNPSYSVGYPWYTKQYNVMGFLSDDNIERTSSPLSSYITYQKYYAGAGLPLKSSRPLCTSSRWFQNIINSYLAKEELKGSIKVPNGNKLKLVSGEELKDKNVKFKVHTPRWLNVDTKPDVINAGMKGLSGGLPQTSSDEDQTEAPFSGIIELNKVYMPYSLTQNDA